MKSNKLIDLTVLLSLLMGFLIYSGLLSSGEHRSEEKAQQDQVAEAIEGLWSPDQAERQEAKARLVRLGDKATDSLVSLLDELMRDRRPRFARTKSGKGETPIPGRTSLEINERLEDDICEVLSQTHSEKAFPILIKFMWKPDSIGVGQPINIAMQTLISIGKPTIPALLQAIDSAEELATSDHRDASTFGTKKMRQDIRDEIFRIQVRAVIVLGRIGDTRAIPMLQHLEEATSNGELRYFCRDAIKRIQEKN